MSAICGPTIRRSSSPSRSTRTGGVPLLCLGFTFQCSRPHASRRLAAVSTSLSLISNCWRRSSSHSSPRWKAMVSRPLTYCSQSQSRSLCSLRDSGNLGDVWKFIVVAFEISNASFAVSIQVRHKSSVFFSFSTPEAKFLHRLAILLQRFYRSVSFSTVRPFLMKVICL